MTNKVVLDTNAFILYMVGLIQPNSINKHKRCSIYDYDIFEFVIALIKDKQIITCPNIITEMDNLLNSYRDEYKIKYILLLQQVLENSVEDYYKSLEFVAKHHFFSIGLTDSIILEMSKEADFLISGDSDLCDNARSLNIEVVDLKEYVSIKL